MNFKVSYYDIYFYICICNYKRNAFVTTKVKQF